MDDRSRPTKIEARIVESARGVNLPQRAVRDPGPWPTSPLREVGLGASCQPDSVLFSRQKEARAHERSQDARGVMRIAEDKQRVQPRLPPPRTRVSIAVEVLSQYLMSHIGDSFMH